MFYTISEILLRVSTYHHHRVRCEATDTIVNDLDWPFKVLPTIVASVFQNYVCIHVITRPNTSKIYIDFYDPEYLLSLKSFKVAIARITSFNKVYRD